MTASWNQVLASNAARVRRDCSMRPQTPPRLPGLQTVCRKGGCCHRVRTWMHSPARAIRCCSKGLDLTRSAISCVCAPAVRGANSSVKVAVFFGSTVNAWGLHELETTDVAPLWHATMLRNAGMRAAATLPAVDWSH